MNFITPVRDQYEKYPYPPISFLALPKRNQGQSLRYELGLQLASALVTPFLKGPENSHLGIRILVAGAGTLEALVVAQAHPQAKELVAIDLSQASLVQLERRIQLARIARFPIKIPPIRMICGDLEESLKSESPFDYILASNVVHHSSQPEKLLRTLSQLLLPGGFLRLVTYPQSSRIWMRQTSLWLHANGLTPITPHLLQRCRSIIGLLPKQHPIRLCFETCSEAKHPSSIVDAWMNACENPLTPLEWKAAAENACLRRIGEAQTESSRSSFLDEILPELRNLDFWDKLQIMDDLLEICSNPVLWFQREPHDLALAAPISLNKIHEKTSQDLILSQLSQLGNTFSIPSRIFSEMKKNLIRIQRILKESNTGVELEYLIKKFKEEVGPRVDPRNSAKTLLGLALTDYNLNDLLDTQIPWDPKIWESLQEQYGPRAQLVCTDYPDRHGKSLLEQEQFFQLKYGQINNSIQMKIEFS